MGNHGQKEQWIPIATKFPSTLVKDRGPEIGDGGLVDGETPNAYGLGIDNLGRLCSGTCPTGTARLSATAVTDPTATTTLVTIANYTWYYWHERLWGQLDAGGSHILYGAHGYEDVHCPLGPGKIECSDGNDTGNVVAMLPLERGGSDYVVAAKAASAYVILSGKTAHPNKPLLVQNWGVSGATYMTDLDGRAFSALASGVWMLDPAERSVVELTYPIRNNLGSFVAVALTSDYMKKRVIGTSKFVVQMPNEATGQRFGLFDYGTAGFLWTSPTIVTPDFSPILFTRLGFKLEHTGTSAGSITVNVKHEGTWSADQTMTFPYERSRYSWMEHMIDGAFQTRRWAMRITAMSGMRILGIYGWGSTAGLEGWTE